MHRENGRCNARELTEILRRIEPDVVFEEIRPSDFESFLAQGIAWSLEAHAIATYGDMVEIRRVPVDRYEVTEDALFALKTKIDAVFSYVDGTSPEYRSLSETNREGAILYGFSYLNSSHFDTVSKRLAEIEDSAICATNNQEMILGLAWWREINQQREREMVRAIYDFCHKESFNEAVFIVGAAHKVGIVREIKRHAERETTPIEWSFSLRASNT